MTTDLLLSYPFKFEGGKPVEFTKEERNDRRRVLRRILKNTRFNNYTDEELDKITVNQNNGFYMLTDINGYDWRV